MVHLVVYELYRYQNSRYNDKKKIITQTCLIPED